LNRDTQSWLSNLGTDVYVKAIYYDQYSNVHFYLHLYTCGIVTDKHSAWVNPPQWDNKV